MLLILILAVTTQSRRVKDVKISHSPRPLKDFFKTSSRRRGEIVTFHSDKKNNFMIPLDLYVLHHCNDEKLLMYLHKYRSIYVSIAYTYRSRCIEVETLSGDIELEYIKN